MRQSKRIINPSLTCETSSSKRLSRKEIRKAKTKRSKIVKAISYAKINHTSKVCVSSNDLNKIKCLSDSDLLNSIKTKTLSNETPVFATSKNKKKKKKKKMGSKTQLMEEEEEEEEIVESFKLSSSCDLRMARLQEFIDQDIKKVNKKTVPDNDKKEVKDNKNTSALIKDKYKLEALKLGQIEDNKEFNTLARKMKLNAYQKKGVFPEFAEEFGGILKDIEEGNMENMNKYSEVENGNAGSDDELENDLLIAIGNKDSKGKQKKRMNKSNKENFEEATWSNSDDNSDSDDGNEHNGLLFDEAEEVDESESYEEELIDDREELAFESGSTLKGGGPQTQNQSHPTLNSFFDQYSSSEEDESDLDGFIVDDTFVEYESEEESDIDEISSNKLAKEKKVKSRIKGRKTINKCNAYDSLSDSSPVKNESSCQNKTNKRRRLCSDSSDCSQYASCNAEEIKKNNLKPKLLVNTCKSSLIKDFDSSSEQVKSKPGKEKSLLAEKLESIVEESIAMDSLPMDKSVNTVDTDSLCKKKNKKRKRKKAAKLIELNTYDNENVVESVSNSEHTLEDCKNTNGEIISRKKKSKKKKGETLIKLEDTLIKTTESILKRRDYNALEIDTKKCNGKLGKKKTVSFSVLEGEKVNKSDDSRDTQVNKSDVSRDTQVNKSDVSRDTPLDECYEDIYGRLRDKQGNVVGSDAQTDSTNIKYIPPAMRKLLALNTDAKKKRQLADLQRSLKGLLNRLAESNLAGIANQVEGYYQSNSRNDMNDVLTNLLFETVVGPALTPERLVQELALLISILSANVGPEVGAHILTEFTVKFVEELEPSANPQNTESKRLDNMLNFISELYNFKVVDSSLIYDILSRLVDQFQEKEVELILLVLRSVGFTLRKDNALALKTFICNVQVKADGALAKEADETFPRVQFMLEVLIAIRNNNISKVPNYDPSHGLHLKSLMKGIVRKGCRPCELKVSLEDLMKSKVHGKWWVIGSAWSGGLKETQSFNEETSPNEVVSNKFLDSDDFTMKFKKKAAKLHMSRPPRINILYIVTEGSENYEDSFEKLIQLKLSPHEEREIFNVIIFCCQRNKSFNKFFPHLAVKLCKFNRIFARHLQLSLWDKFKELHNLAQKETANLAKFIAHVISENGLNMSLFKKLNFLEADEQMISFLRQTLIAILLHSTGIFAVSQAFNHLCSSPKLQVLRQSIRLFIIKFITPKKTESSKEMQILSSRVKLASDILTSAAGVNL